jgi:TolB-like protein/DNA-binding winged helix-turn-helix (wHTH) protein/Tfp pilus assembly protein PilF
VKVLDRSARLVRFEGFQLDLRAGELRPDAGKTLRLSEQPFRILTMLLERPGEVLTREEIRKELWPDNTIVEFEHSINAAMNRLRQALGDSGDHPRYIETLPRRGYRFIAPVTTSPAAPVVAMPGGVASLAILPLVNETGDPETEYLSDGISESVINLLSQFPNLRVIPRTSAFRYRGTELDLETIGRRLNVSTVLTGKLIRHGDRLVVQTDLVDVVSDAQIWGGQFNRKLEDIFEVQEELARQISENLQVRLTPEDEKRLAKRPTQSREAYQLLLKAQYHVKKITPEGLQQGMAYAWQAIEADPRYAEAYAWLSVIYARLGFFSVAPAAAFPKAKAAALQALEIDDSLAEAHLALAVVRLFYEWDWSGAEHACKRSMELKPNFASAHATWGDWLFIMGREEEAMAEAQLATELDPLSTVFNVKLADKLSRRGDQERALEVLNKALEFDPDFVLAHVLLALVYAWKGMHVQSLATYEKVASLFGGNPFSRAVHSLILAIVGKKEEAKQILDELKKHPKLDSFSLIYLAGTCSVMGEKNEAFELLESAYREHVPALIYVGVRPTFDNIRSDPRYADLLCRMRLPLVPVAKPS